MGSGGLVVGEKKKGVQWVSNPRRSPDLQRDQKGGCGEKGFLLAKGGKKDSPALAFDFLIGN